MYSLYTDGSCLCNPGTGGWAAVLVKEEAESPIFQCCGGESGTTNNIMELTAVIEGLTKYKSFNLTGLDVYTDSQYVKNGITEWIHKWKVNNWRTATGSAVKNADLWKKLDKLVEECPGVRFKWVKAHRGDRWNEHVDDLAKRTAQLIKFS
jgi:ribonuclease HI